jgi:tRNA (mo5U34)-methyltransferase
MGILSTLKRFVPASLRAPLKKGIAHILGKPLNPTRIESELKTFCRMKSARHLTANQRELVEQKIRELGPWFHNFQIAEDVWTNPEGNPGPQYPDSRWQVIQPCLPDVAGKSVLDIGCSSGFFSLKMKELGAAYVLGVDAGEQPKAIDQARFAAETLRLDIDFKICSVYDLATIGKQFDIVLFMGVFYHLRHPLLALEAVRPLCRETLIFQTITTRHEQTFTELESNQLQNSSLHSPLLQDLRYPSMRFVEGALDKDVTCWFVPNPQAVMSMLRSCSFKPNHVAYSDTNDIVVRCSV